jgi:hypothetical protein
VEHERISIDAKFGDNEGHTVGHQAGHKSDVPREAVELGNNDRAFVGAPRGQRCGELRPAIEGASAPLPVSISTNSLVRTKSSASAKC